MAGPNVSYSSLPLSAGACAFLREDGLGRGLGAGLGVDLVGLGDS